MITPARARARARAATVRATAAAVLAAPRPSAVLAHELARDALLLCDEAEGLGRKAEAPRVAKTSADAILVERARATRGVTLTALAAEVEVGVSVLGRANVRPVPRRVRAALREMLGEPGGEEVGEG